jgi:hypothetical protein
MEAHISGFNNSKNKIIACLGQKDDTILIYDIYKLYTQLNN